MSFRYVPSLLRIPEVPHFSPPNGFWVGVDQDSGLFAFTGSYGWGYNLIVRNDFCYSLKIGNSVLKPVYSSINGYVYWRGNGVVYYSLSRGWIYMPSEIFPGYEPIEEWEWGKEEPTWSGDAFYEISNFPYGPDETGTLTPRGRIYGGEPKELSLTWPRWKSDREFGKYTGDGESGDKYLGFPRFRGNGEYFVRSYAKDKGHYTYGRIHYADGKWVIGEVGSDAGWHEGSEPSRDGGSVTFKFMKNEGSEAKGNDITVSLYDFVKGEETFASYLGEAAIWR